MITNFKHVYKTCY